MASTTLASSAASRGGVKLLGPQRRTEDLLALLALLIATALGLMAGYARADDFGIGVAGKHDVIHMQTFHEPEAFAGQRDPSYRWTQERSTIMAPGLGRGLWHTQVELSSPQPVGRPKQTVLEVGSYRTPVQLQPGQRVFHLLTPSDGDLHMHIDTPVGQYGADPRLLGVVFFNAEFQPVVVSVAPPTPLLLHSVVAILLGFLTLRLIGLRTSHAALLALPAIMLLIWGLSANRSALGLYSIRMLALSLLGLLLMAAIRWAAPKLFRLGGVEITPAVLTGLLVIVYASYLFRVAGLLWPYFAPIDIAWHMEKARRVLTGRLGELWRADSPFHQSVMPALWGENKPVIPYSPFYHIFSAMWAIFPWKLETSANVYSGVIDSLRPLMIFFIVRKFGFRDRAALIGALTYTIIPATFLMHAWGNTPTTNGMWWSLLSTTVLVGTWDRLRESRAAWLGLTVVLTINMLFYAVTAVFTTLVLSGVILGLALTGRGRIAVALTLSLTTAILLSTGIYYWQFIGPIIERTIPKFTGAIKEGGKDLGVTPISWPEYLWKYVYLLDIYGVYLPLTLGIAGWWLGVRKFGAHSLFTPLMTTWMIISITFWFIGFKVDMVDKQLFWLMPWMGIGAGIAVDRMLDISAVRRWTAPVLILAGLYIGSDALYLWVHRIRGYGLGEGYTSWYQLLLRAL